LFLTLSALWGWGQIFSVGFTSGCVMTWLLLVSPEFLVVKIKHSGETEHIGETKTQWWEQEIHHFA